MELITGDKELEALNVALNEPGQLDAYKKPYDDYRPALLPRILGHLLVLCGNIVYGFKPSYMKFRAVEVIARVPYHSWASAAFTLLTLCYSSEEKAVELSKTAQYSRVASDNETMHVVVISHIAQKEERVGFIRHSLIPMLFGFFYFWMSYILYLLRPRLSYELNYLFESHAFEQYNEFLKQNEEALKHKPVISDFLPLYGRNPINQYDFFCSIRNDELIHRNQSIHKIDMAADARRVRKLWSLVIFILVVGLMWQFVF